MYRPSYRQQWQFVCPPTGAADRRRSDHERRSSAPIVILNISFFPPIDSAYHFASIHTSANRRKNLHAGSRAYARGERVTVNCQSVRTISFLILVGGTLTLTRKGWGIRKMSFAWSDGAMWVRPRLRLYGAHFSRVDCQ